MNTSTLSTTSASSKNWTSARYISAIASNEMKAKPFGPAVKDKRYEHIHAVNDKRFFKKLTTTRVSFMGAMAYTGFAQKRCFISFPIEVGAAPELSLAL